MFNRDGTAALHYGRQITKEYCCQISIHGNIIYNVYVYCNCNRLIADHHKKTKGSVYTDAGPAFDLLWAHTC